MREGARFTPRAAAHPSPRARAAPSHVMGGACVKAAREASEGEGEGADGLEATVSDRRGKVPLPAIETVVDAADAPAPSSSSSSRAVASSPSIPTGRFQSVESWTRARAARSAKAEDASPAGGTRPSVSRAAPAASAASADASADEGDAPRDPFAPASPPAAPSPLPSMTHVHVVVVSCAGLRGADFTSYSDPFVEVCALGASKKHRHRTSPVRQNLNPTWDTAESRFLVPCATDAHGDAFRGVALSVFDRDFGASSEFLGGATVSPDDIPRWGQWVELTLDLQQSHPEGSHPGAKRGKYAVPAGSPSDLGKITVRISAADDAWDERGFAEDGASPKRAKLPSGRWTAERAAAHGHPIRHVHVCVVAGKHLVATDDKGLTDAFVRVQLDNAPRSDRRGRGNRTAVAKRTLDPVWGNGAGETFTLERRPGAAEVQLLCYDAENVTGNQFLGVGTVPLATLPADGSWSENRLVPLYPEGPSARAAHSGESTGFLVVRCAASSPMPRCETWPEPRRFWPNAASPPPPPSEPYLHKVQSSTFVYFQVCGARDLPLTREGEPTNVRATVALNSHRMVHQTAVQEDVLADSVWTPEVFSFARNPNSAFITVRVYGNLTKMWDPDALAVFAKDATMGVVDVGADAQDVAGHGGDGGGGAKSVGAGSRAKSGSGSGAASRAVDSLRKRQFALGTLIGEVKISIKDLVVGSEPETRWLPILPAIRNSGLFGGAPPRWLSSRGDALGELCVAVGSGYLRQPPEDLINPGDHQIRPQLGTLEVQLVSVEGDENAINAAKGDPAGWFTPLRVSRDRARDSPVDLLGSRVFAQLLFEGRAEKVASTFEHRAFEVTEPASELRVLFFCEGPLALDEVFLGAAMLPVRHLLRVLDGEMDAWLDVVPPTRVTTEGEMQDCKFQMRVARARARVGWRGRVRVRAKLTKLAPAHRWYLCQPARRAGDPHVDDTIRGVVNSAERVVTSFFAPITAFVASLAHCQSGADPHLNRAWIAWHTALCLLARRHVWGAFFPLWVVSGWVFVGYTCARAREMDKPAPLYHGRRVLRALDARDDAPLAPTASILKTTRARREKGRGKRDREEDEREYESNEEEEERVAIADLLRSKEKAKMKAAEAAKASKDGGGGSGASTTTNLSDIRVAGFEHESRSELCRLRVQCWLREIRVRRKRVLLELEREEREAALRASGKSPKSTIKLLRKAHGSDRRRARASSASTLTDEDVDDTDPMQVLLRWLRLNKIARILSAANPAEIIMRVLQQIIWQLLVILRSTGSTLVNVTVSLGRVHKVLEGPCRKACAALDPLADSLERLGGVLSFRDEALSAHVSVLLLGLTLALCIALRLTLVPLCRLFDAHSPVRTWHLAWLLGVFPCVGAGAPKTVCVKIVVVVERTLQNLLGSVHVAPICIHSIEALERALEETFAAAGGTWEGLEAVMRAEELERKKKENDAAEAATERASNELKMGTANNPLRWLAHAANRAPTRADHEHATRVRQLIRPTRVGEGA